MNEFIQLFLELPEFVQVLLVVSGLFNVFTGSLNIVGFMFKIVSRMKLNRLLRVMR